MQHHLEVRPGSYRDSVSLMEVSGRLRREPGITDAMVSMGTELNLEMLAGMGFSTESAGSNDLLIAITGSDEASISAALLRLDVIFTEMDTAGRNVGGSAEMEPPRTMTSASPADLALISLPGPQAFAEAMDALEAGMNVMIFSDNVPVEEEIALKQFAHDHGLIVMGPDCGTAVINGAALGFANIIRSGPVGIVAASGTGAQQVMTLLDHAGVGVSHCIGVGGRDLSHEVSGISTIDAIRALDQDPATELVLVISKPPASRVREELNALAAELDTPVVFGLLGDKAGNLTKTVIDALEHLSLSEPEWPKWFPEDSSITAVKGHLRAYYAGGTICDEAMIMASARLDGIRSNIPLQPSQWIDPMRDYSGHIFIDFGDDQMTLGRPHPMIDPTLRNQRITDAGRDSDCGLLLIDVVLGYAADPDPAATIAPAIRQARQDAKDDGRELPVAVALIGTAADPQGMERQAIEIRNAGAHVFTSNAEAALWSLSHFDSPSIGATS
jgi:FdrA protein